MTKHLIGKMPTTYINRLLTRFLTNTICEIDCKVKKNTRNQN